MKKVEKSLSKGVFKLGSVTGKLSEESRTNLRKVASLSLGPAGIVGGGSECTVLSPSSIPEQGTEPPAAPRAAQHKWLPTAPGVCSRCVCVFTAVCVHLDG